VPNRLPEPLRRAKTRIRPTYRRLTSSSRSLPDFVIIGAQKAGTTSLMRYLQSHPDVVTEPGVGEVHFFDIRWELGEATYRSYFPTRHKLRRRRAATSRTTLTGEKTPAYLFHPLAPERAHATIPDARLIAILRNPITRAASHHRMNANSGIDQLGLGDAIDAEPARVEPSLQRLAAGDPPMSGYDAFYYSYVTRGRYADQLHAWLRYFSRDQLLVLRSEDLAADPASTYATTLEFLGLAPHHPEFARYNSARRPYEVAPEVNARLEALFREPNQRLAEEFGISW
jgi:Sulfotransferase domain